MVHSLSEQTGINKGIGTGFILMTIAIGVLIWFQLRNFQTINNIARNSQEKFDNIDRRFEIANSRISEIENSKSEFATRTYLEERSEALREGYYDFYEEFKNFVRKAEARIPALKNI